MSKLDLRDEITINGCDGYVQPQTNKRTKALFELTQDFSESIQKLKDDGRVKKKDEKLAELQVKYYEDIAGILIDWKDEEPDYKSDEFEYGLLIRLRDFFLGLLKID